MADNRFSKEFDLTINNKAIEFNIHTNRKYPKREAMLSDYIDCTLLELADNYTSDMFLTNDKSKFPYIEYESPLIISGVHFKYWDEMVDLKWQEVINNYSTWGKVLNDNRW